MGSNARCHRPKARGLPVLNTRAGRCVTALGVGLAASLAAGADAVRVGHLTVDYASFLSRNDIVYLSPPREGWEGLPLGNGRLGAQAWQPDGLTFQLNTPLSGVYGGAIARIHLGAEPGPLTGLRSYEQRLSLCRAAVTTHSRHTNGERDVAAFIPADADALVLEVADTRPDARHRVEMEVWRSSASLRVADGILLLTDALKLAGEPDYRFAIALGLDDPKAAARGLAALGTAAPRFVAYAAFAATRDPRADVAAEAMGKLAELRRRGLAAVRQAHEAAWAAFWAKSILHLHSADGVADYLENLWHIHLYAMACGSRGEVPPKFNGGLWTDDRDLREWGAAFWHWNTQETYWPLYAANHLDLLRPYYDMYFGMLPTVRAWTKEMYGLDGAQFQETIPFNGRMGKWPTVRGVHPRVPVPTQFAHTNAILSSSAEIAMQFWWAWLYTGDEAFLRDRAYPLMKEATLFYLGYLEKDKQGRYIIWPSNAHETYWRVQNPATDLAAVRYLFPAVLRAAETLNCDPDLRARCREALDHLAPYPLDPKTGAILPFEPQPGEKIEVSNAENPELFPIGVFPLIALGSPDYALALKTFHARKHVNTSGWTTDSICAARLGIADDEASRRLFPGWTPADRNGWGIERLLPNHAELYQDHPNGLMDYYGREPAIHPYLEGSGTFATACGEMLLQSWDGVIRVAIALPRAWNAKFTLLAMGGFLVSAECEGGKVLYVAIESQRGGEARLANPFEGPALVRQGDQTLLRSADSMFSFPTTAGGTYLVVPESQPDAARGRPVLTGTANAAPKRLSPASQRWIGKLAPPTLGQKPSETNPPQPPPVPARMERSATPLLEPVRAAAPPKIDGVLDEPIWKEAKPLGAFVLAGSGAPAQEQTEIRLACDKDFLYVAITAWESQMDCQLATCQPPRHGQAVEMDDSVSILIRPLASSTACWRLAVNPLGARYAALCTQGGARNAAVNPKWDVAVRRWSNRWTIEAAIPYLALAPDPPAAGSAWGIRIERREMPRGERSAFPAATASGPLAVPATSEPLVATAAAFATLRFAEGAPAPERRAIEPGLVGHWPGEITGGIWVRDQSGNGLHGLIVGDVRPEFVVRASARTPDGLKAALPTEKQPALALRGGYIEVPDSPLLNMKDALTLMAWVRPEQVGGMRLFNKTPVG